MDTNATGILPSGRVRHSIRLPGYDYTSAGWYFVTFCVQNRECAFGEMRSGGVIPSEAGRFVQDCWQAIPVHFPYVDLDAWVLMPNHLHGILAIRPDTRPRDNDGDLIGTAEINAAGGAPTERWRKVAPGSLSAIVRSFKSASTREVNKARGTAGATLWQRNYFEHVIRDDRDLERIRVYIQENPARWELDQENPANLANP